MCSNYEKCDGDKSDNHGGPSDIPFAELEEPQGTTLTEAMDEIPSDRSKGRHKSKRSTYASPQGSLSLGKLDRIVERTFDFDLDEAAKEVDEFLAPGDDRRLDFGLLQTELDRSTEMAILAHRLYTNAREACEIFEIDRDIIISAMRDSARYTLEQDLRNKIRLKPITDADVLSMMKMQDPGKWRDLKVKAVRMEATRDHLERVSDLARKRIDVLNTLVEKKR